jgi:hypothetical protein
MATQYPDYAKKLRDESSRARSNDSGNKNFNKSQDTEPPPAAQSQSFESDIQEMITAKPLVALAAALGAGFVASLVLRRRKNHSETDGMKPESKTAKAKPVSREVH